jgi:hypothetical protein
MRTEEAKFILAAFRPGGGDAGNPTFDEALRMAAGDPALRTWFAQSRAHDAAVAAKLGEIQPPAGLREAILAGGRVGAVRRGGSWGWYAGLAAAAAVVLCFTSLRILRKPETATRQLADFAITDMVNGRHGGSGELTGVLISQLQAAGGRMPGPADIDFEKLRDTGCRTLNFAGHDLIEVCFARDGAEFHLYVTRRDGPLGDSVTKGPAYFTEPGGTAAVWSDARFDYAVATTAGVAALRHLL